jgi:hypothetical protein
MWQPIQYAHRCLNLPYTRFLASEPSVPSQLYDLTHPDAGKDREFGSECRKATVPACQFRSPPPGLVQTIFLFFGPRA